MKNIVGTPALGNNFFDRSSEIKKIFERLEDGNNIQIAAPRRIGKTSILHYLKDNKIGGHIYIYVDTERVDNEADFYKKLLKTILKCDEISNSRKISELFKKGGQFLGKIKSIKIMGQGIDFSEEKKDADYLEDITNFLCALELEKDTRLILLIDEFPQTILNIVDTEDGNTKAAIDFLKSNRELRLNPDILNKIQFIYTGSIGLNHTVASINASAFVNDLNSIEIDPLTVEEAEIFIHELLKEKNITIEPEVVSYLLNKILWLIPFHIQLSAQELSMMCRETKKVTIENIDAAFDQMVERRNNNHFDHYYSRLKSQFKNASLDFALTILEKIAIVGNITKAEIHNEAVGTKITDEYKQIIEILNYDGYINNNADHNSYQFNSPVLRLWWQKFIIK